MCGIVGLHLKNPDLYPRLGELLAPMLAAMGERGPDSAGIAVYEDGLPEGMLRYTLRAPGAGFDWEPVESLLGEALGDPVELRRAGHDAVVVAGCEPELVTAALRSVASEVRLVGWGRAMEVYKDLGSPREICRRYGIEERSGYQGLGHTRMATESAVTTDHSHPFAAGPDLCLVHDGSFSNYATIRRGLSDEGIEFDTDNDSEVAARYIADRVSQGFDLAEVLKMVLDDFDGFFTLLVATIDRFAVVRDAFACKPAVIVECDDYVAMASEFRALAGLPGVGTARVFEPMPEEIHSWSR